MANFSSRPQNIKNTGFEAQILKTITTLSDQIFAKKTELLSIWGMTVLQHNALQVLYDNDTQKTGLSNKEIGRGLTTRVPDITRLLDRLADKGWVKRERDNNNRRIVRTTLTQIGTELVESSAQPLIELQQKMLAHMTQQEKEQLASLLKSFSEEVPDLS